MIDSFSGPHRFLSNFWPCGVDLDGVAYPSTEAAYQAAKTLDVDARRVFERAQPGQAKTLGRRVVLRADWEDVKVDVMRDLLAQKFAPGSDLAALLSATSPHELVEGNHWNDTFWGVCRGKGQNLLGRLLTGRRTELSAAVCPPGIGIFRASNGNVLYFGLNEHGDRVQSTTWVGLRPAPPVLAPPPAPPTPHLSLF